MRIEALALENNLRTENDNCDMSTKEQYKNNDENKSEEIDFENKETSAEPSRRTNIQLAKNVDFQKEKMNVVKNVMRNDDEFDWGARGWCRTHCLMGTKVTSSSKKCCKKKDWLNGWIYSSEDTL